MRIGDGPAQADVNLTRDSSHGEPSTALPADTINYSLESTPPTVQYVVRVCRWLSQGLTIGLVCALPWWFGGIQPRAQLFCGATVLVAAVLTLGTELLGKQSPLPRIACDDRYSIGGQLPANDLGERLGEGAEHGRASAPRSMLILLFAALAFGGFQLLPLPHRVLAAIAPQNAFRWRQLTPIYDDSADAAQLRFDTGYWPDRKAWPVSLYSASTKHDLALLCVAVGVFLIGAFQFSSDRAILALLVSVTVCGALFGFFGIAQQLTWTGKIYGLVPLSNGGTPFAAFVNRNNAGGFLNLCLAASLGLLAWSLGFHERRGEGDVPQLPDAATRPPSRRAANRQDWREILATVTGLQVFAGLMTIVVLGAVLCTLSRGAVLACFLSFVLLAIASRWFLKNRSLGLAGWVLLALCGAGLTAWVGRFDDIQQRAESIKNVISHPDGRWGHWRDSLTAAADFFPLGSGLGTHRFIYRIYEQFPTSTWFYHAENQYVEAFVEGGGPALGLLVAAIVLTFAACWQLLTSGTGQTDLVIGGVGLFAISAQSIHACFDFGLYLPANMCMLALICGVVHGRSANGNRRAHSNTQIAGLKKGVRPPTPWAFIIQVLGGRGLPAFFNPRNWFLGQTVRTSVATAMCALLVAAVINLFGQAQADAAIRLIPAKSLLASEISVHPPPIRELELASLADPTHAETRLLAAQAWIDRYRHAAWDSLVALRPTADPNSLWTLTEPAEVHTSVRNLEQSRRSVELEDVRSSRAVRDNLVPAVRHLLAARAACPLLPDVHLLLGELEPIISSSADAGQGVERVRICAPRRSQLLAEAGLVAMVDSQPDLAALMWQQAGTVEPQRLPTLLRLASSQTIMRNHLREMLPPDVALLVSTARASFSSAKDKNLQALITKYAKEILPAAKIDDAQRWHLEGVLLLLEGQPEAAIDRLTKASGINPLEVTWRFDLAAALADHGMTERAREHASFCVRMDPDNEQYAVLLKRLIRTSLTSQ